MPRQVAAPNPFAQVASVIVPDSLITLTRPAAVTDPLRFPLAPVKLPVPPTITSVSVPELGAAGLGWHTPGQVGLLKNSSMKSEPPLRLIVRKSQLPPQPLPNAIVSVA
jgi:hypothetical protein